MKRNLIFGIILTGLIIGFNLKPAYCDDPPQFEWAHTYLSQTGHFSTPYKISTDTFGTIISGNFSGVLDFNPGDVVDNRTSFGSYGDGFVTKTNPDGSYAWTQQIGAANENNYVSMHTVDHDGNIYVGVESSGNITLEIIKKFSPNGTLLWTVNAALPVISVAVNDNDHTIVVASGAYVSGRIEKRDMTNGAIIWEKTLDNIEPLTILIDHLNNIYYAGRFTGTADFNPNGGGDPRTTHQGLDAFVTKLNSDGSYGWTRTFDVDTDGKSMIAIDEENYIYSLVSLQPTSYRPIINKLSPLDGSSLWTDTFTSSIDVGTMGMGPASSGNLIIAGGFSNSVDFDPTSGTDTRISTGGYDGFVTKLNRNNGSYVGTFTFTGTAGSFINDIAIDSQENMFVAGGYYGSGYMDMDPGDGSVNSQLNSSSGSIFVIKLRRANHAPVTTAPATIDGYVGTRLKFYVSVTDQDPGDTVQVSFSNVPSWGGVSTSYNGTNYSYSFFGTPTQAGVFQVTVNATDGHDTVHQNVLLNIRAALIQPRLLLTAQAVPVN